MIRVDASEKISMKFTPEGYLRGEAVVSRSGVFDYLDSEGNVRKELRHPDDVFTEKSLKTLSMIPVTVDHPQTLLTLETASELTVGQTGEKVRVDGKKIIAPFTITNKKGIEAFQKGKKELSLGYSCDLVEEEGEYNGEIYTHRQTNIEYNHLSLVDRARAGSIAKINLDAAFQIQGEKSMDKKLEKISLDGLDYEASPEVKKAFEKSLKEIENLKMDKKSREDLQKEYDELKAKADALKEELDKLKEEKSDSIINQKVKERLSLERKALKLNPNGNFDSLNENEIMVDSIKKVRPNFDSKDKSSEYIKASFDLALESLGDPKAIQKQKTQAIEKTDGENLDSKKLAHTELLKMWTKKGNRLCK